MGASLRDHAIRSIQQSFRALSNTHDLSPNNDKVTTCLTDLVRTLTKCQSPELSKFILETPVLAAERAGLPDLCGRAECEMEKFWARKLAASPACSLADFWYFPEYTALCRAELGLFKKKTFSRISFLGAGALPLTAFMLAQQLPKTHITCVDFDAEACDLSAQLSRRIGMQDQVTVECMDARAYTPVDNELVICASLLEGKENLYTRLDKFACALIVRDAEGPYQYLYKPAELPKPRFVERAKTTINAKRINTSRYYEQEAASHVLAA